MTSGELARYGFSEEKAGNGQSEPGQRAGHATMPLAFAWPDIAVMPDRHRSEEQRRPGCLRQGDRYRGQAMVLRKGERPDLEGCPGLRPGMCSPSPRRGKTATGPLSIRRNRARRPCRSRSRGEAQRADKAQKHGDKAATAALCATPTCTGPGFRRNQSWPG